MSKQAPDTEVQPSSAASPTHLDDTEMKLYCFPIAPNPSRVMVYLREKGIDLEEITVSLIGGEQHQPEHLARNPLGGLPVLELDDGTYISQSLPIVEYLEELHPDPVMIGADPLTRLRVRALERQVETTLMSPLMRIVHATNSPLGLPPAPEVAALERAKLPTALELINTQIGHHAFVAGDSPTIADCTLFAALFFAEFRELTVTQDYPDLHRWYTEFKARPSTKLL